MGHTSCIVESNGQKMIVAGDLIHAGAVQFTNPSVIISFEADKKATSASRETAFTQAAREGALVGAAHISLP